MTYYDREGRPADRAGHTLAHTLRATTMMRAAPGLYDQFHAIPDEFWNEDDEGEMRMAVVACPCGESPSVELDKFEECGGCERFYWFADRDVRVANSPKDALIAAAPDPEDPVE